MFVMLSPDSDCFAGSHLQAHIYRIANQRRAFVSGYRGHAKFSACPVHGDTHAETDNITNINEICIKFPNFLFCLIKRRQK